MLANLACEGCELKTQVAGNAEGGRKKLGGGNVAIKHEAFHEGFGQVLA